MARRLVQLSRMVRWPSEFYPGLEDLHLVDEREARRFAVTVLEAAEKSRASDLKARASERTAEVVAANAAELSALEGL